MPALDYFVERTDQKLRFSRIHLDELRGHPTRNSGADFERAHPALRRPVESAQYTSAPSLILPWFDVHRNVDNF